MQVTLAQFEGKLAGSVRDLNVTETQARPPGRWSIQQIIEHLTLTYDATESILKERLGKGRPTLTRPTFAQHCGRVMITQLGYFPSGRKAPSVVTPTESPTALPGGQLACKVEERLKMLDRLLEETARTFGKDCRSVSHIVLGPLTPAEWRNFHVAHGLHHLRQIVAIKRLDNFVS